MTQPTQPASSTTDLGASWSSARRLFPVYAELAREFALDAPSFPALDETADSPDREIVDRAQQWLQDMDERIHVHQLRQFLQTTSLVDRDGLTALLQHYLAKTPRTDSSRDKLDFLLVQYFSQGAPPELDDNGVDIAYVAAGLVPVLGEVELKTPVWLNALDRALEAARRCRSLDELLHGAVLEQGRKAKAQAGDLFYLPIALVAFTRFGYLMRRVFFRLMLTDLNSILEGLTKLEEEGVETIDCRRAQFSAQEPIIRLRMICQSWKVMFQAEYSSGQPLRMLVDLRLSVDAALGSELGGAAADARGTASSQDESVPDSHPKARAAAASATSGTAAGAQKRSTRKKKTKFAVANAHAPEFEVSPAPPEREAEDGSSAQTKK